MDKRHVSIRALLFHSALTLLVCLQSVSLAYAAAVDRSTPEAVIKTLCHSRGPALQELFHPDLKLEPAFYDRKWLACVQSTKTPAHDVGSPVGLKGMIVSKDDVEIVLRVKMDDKKRGNPVTGFSYLLRRFDDGWRIISISHIPDRKYPRYD